MAVQVHSLEPAKLRLHTRARERQGIIGNWLSHLSAYMRFAHLQSGPDLLLILEDDAQARDCV